MRKRARAVFLLLVVTATALAQTPATREMTIIAGKGELLSFGREINRVVVSEPKIADAQVVSPNEVMVNAKLPGTTTLVVWETGASPVRWDVHVKADTSEWDRFRTNLTGLVPDSAVDASADGDTIVLTGNVK